MDGQVLILNAAVIESELARRRTDPAPAVDKSAFQDVDPERPLKTVSLTGQIREKQPKSQNSSINNQNPNLPNSNPNISVHNPNVIANPNSTGVGTGTRSKHNPYNHSGESSKVRLLFNAKRFQQPSNVQPGPNSIRPNIPPSPVPVRRFGDGKFVAISLRGIPPDTPEDQIIQFFAQFQLYQPIPYKLVKDKVTRKFTGQSYLNFETREEAVVAIAYLQGKYYPKTYSMLTVQLQQ
jgi:hypothetical protein